MATSSQLETGDARRVVLPVGGRPVATLQAGPDSGPPALLVPGFTGSKEDFGPILAPLAAAGFRAVAMDQPGQHESPGPPDPADYTPDRLATTVLGIAERLGAPVHLLGHSFGGLVARAAVISAPAAIRSLVLLDSGPSRLDGQRRLRIERMQPLLSSLGMSGLYAAMQAESAADPAFVAPPAELAEFLQRRFLGSSMSMLQGMGDALRVEPDRVDELAATGVRTLVAHGVEDDAWPPEAQRRMAERLGARYAIVPAAAHSPAVENPDATAELLTNFWG